MASCHQCNSQVGENDLFCPFCGAKLPAGSEAGPPDEVSANATTERSMTDIPIPEIIADFGQTSDNVAPEDTAEFSLVEEGDVPLQAADLDAKTAEEDLPSIAAEAPTVPEAGEPSAERPGIFDERPLYKDDSISQPLGELEDVDQPRSMFDSVRIMESKPQDDVDTRIQTASDPLPEAPVPAVLSQVTHAEPKPYTEPSIGRGDTDGKRSAKLKPLSEGTVLNGRYEIVRKIGGGGMGAVYLASDNNLGGVVRAVKEMVQSHIEEEQQDKAIQDFKRESMILSTLDHPSIPTIYDYFFDDVESRFYLVMKYI